MEAYNEREAHNLDNLRRIKDAQAWNGNRINLLKLIKGGNRHQPQPRMRLGWATRADHRGNPLVLPDPSMRGGVTGKVQPCHPEHSEASRCPIEPDPSLRSG